MGNGSKPSNNGQTDSDRRASSWSNHIFGRTERLTTPYGNPHTQRTPPSNCPPSTSLSVSVYCSFIPCIDKWLWRRAEWATVGGGAGGGGGMGEHRKHHCHEQIAAAFGKLINPRCSRSTQCVELLWGFVGIQCIYRVTSHNYVLNAAPYVSLSLWQPF